MTMSFTHQPLPSNSLQISSVRVLGSVTELNGASLTLFQDSHFGGRQQELFQDSSDLMAFGNLASSLAVTGSQPWTLYT